MSKIKKIKNNILLNLWQLPQNILGLLIKIFCFNKIKSNWWQWDYVEIIISKNIKNSFCLGRYIFVNENSNNYNIISYEYGNYLLSRLFGPLYLFLIFIPNIINHIIHGYNNHIFYNTYPSKWANNLSSKYVRHKIKKLIINYRKYEKASSERS